MANDPVCGMTVEIKNAAAQEQYQGSTVYFCSDSCHSKFVANPTQYIKTETLTDPVCAMTVSKDSTHHMVYADKNFYFCSDSCLNKFKEDPGLYI